MRRKITEKLLNWKNDHSDKPLMLLGARQTGKTYSLDQFCKSNFDNYVYLNLELEAEIRQIFDQTLDPVRLINAVSIIKNKEINTTNSVLFIDEIQESERAISALKYFAESDTKYKVVCAGSVLGVALNRMTTSFPVGKVYRQYMFAMDFEEFLWGIGEENLACEIALHYFDNTQMLSALHDKALQLYKHYLYVGGMPASVKEFKRSKQLLSGYDDAILSGILDDYMADMHRYTTATDAVKINKIYRSIPKHLGRENSKFTYKLVERNGNKRYFQNALDWLRYSYIVQTCQMVKIPKIPLAAYEDESKFKVYANDTGLLARLANFTKNDLYSDEINLFSGVLTENYVANTFKSNGLDLYYWKSKHDAEIDFVINIGGNIIPVEVKAAHNTKSKSLKVYTEKYNPKYAIKLSSKNFGFINNIKSVPLYAAHLIK